MSSSLHRLPFAAASGGYSLVTMHGLLITVASLAVEHGLLGARASTAAAHGAQSL